MFKLNDIAEPPYLHHMYIVAHKIHVRTKENNIEKKKNERISTGQRETSYRKISKISPRAYIFQRLFLRGLFLEGLIFGGAYLWKKNCVSKSIGLAL